MNSIGISDIALYIPSLRINIEDILDTRRRENPAQAERIARAVTTTGQRAIRFSEPGEDSATLAATAAKKLIDRIRPEELRKLRYLVIGTETGLDMSKPLSAYVSGMLLRAGYPLPAGLSNFQVQHACAGGTLAMVSVASLIQANKQQKEKGIVVCSDIARYEAATTAEITQGAGAASLLIEQNPRLIELDLAHQGYYSSDVDDFFRPLGSDTARVRGRFSISCYHHALDEALKDYSLRSGEDIHDIIADSDIFVFHVPFPQMAIQSIKRLLNTYLNMKNTDADNFLKERGFYSALNASAYIGNTYTAALYLNMAAQLSEYYRLKGNAIVGKKVLIASYGSGNIMVLLSGRVTQNAPSQIEHWDLANSLNHDRKASWAEYEYWMKHSAQPMYPPINLPHETPLDIQGEKGSKFVLESIREDGYRNYIVQNSNSPHPSND